jgi:uncharacterized membrane protein
MGTIYKNESVPGEFYFNLINQLCILRLRMPKATSSIQRIYSIDILRGAVMIIMALDHVRDFFHYTASTDSPTNLLTTTPLLFFTRWITHFCAPTFVFLAGISAFLFGQKKTTKELSIFLVKRGAWLIIAEVLIVSLAWTFDPFYHLLILQVIWAIGISMIILGLLIWLPLNLILIFGLMIICFHNILDYAEINRNGHVGLFWDLAHYGKFEVIKLIPKHFAIIVYAFLPWTGILMMGYGLGRLFASNFNSARRRNLLFLSGTICLLIFIILRSINLYGDPSHWLQQRNLLFSFFSFINLTKYPPSLDYIAMTIGVAMIALGLLDRISIRHSVYSFLRLFGTVPFFYYVIHLYLIHFFTLIFFFLEKYPAKDIAPQHSPFLFRPDRFGFGLGVVYLIWIFLILILYPICNWYPQYKTTHKQWWLSYI